MVLGGAAGLGLGYLLIVWIQNRSAPEPKEQASKPQPRPAVVRTPKFTEFPKLTREAEPAVVPAAPTFVAPYSGFGPPSAGSLDSSSSPSGAAKSSPKVADRDTNPVAVSPAPPKPQPPLAGVTDVLKLPSLVDTAAVVLCKLHVPAGKTLDLSFNAVAANIPAEAGFLTELQPGASPVWLVSYAPNLNGAANEKKPLAELTHAAGELAFQWRSPIEDAPARKELSNCLLRLSCDSVEKTALLRAPSLVPRLALDLNRDVSSHSLPALDLPKEDGLRLEIALTGFPAGAALKDDKRVLKLKERTTIEFAQFEGAVIQLEFRRLAASDLQVVLRPEFRENSVDKFAMTLPRLAGLKAALETSIPEGEAKYVALGKDLKALDKQLRDLGPRPGGAAFVVWQSNRTRIESSMSSCKSQASRLARRLPGMKARLAAVPAMQRFLGEMHQKASLTVKVYAECGDARLVMIDARLDPAAEQEQSPKGRGR